MTDIKITIEVAPDRGPTIVKHLEKFADESLSSFERRLERAIKHTVEQAKSVAPPPQETTK